MGFRGVGRRETDSRYEDIRTVLVFIHDFPRIFKPTNAIYQASKFNTCLVSTVHGACLGNFCTVLPNFPLGWLDWESGNCACPSQLLRMVYVVILRSSMHGRGGGLGIYEVQRIWPESTSSQAPACNTRITVDGSLG